MTGLPDLPSGRVLEGSPRAVSRLEKRCQWSIGFISWALVTTLAWTGVAAAQGIGGTITGTVTNATPGGRLPVGVPVVLQFYSEGAWTSAYTTTLAADGTYQFDDLGDDAGGDFLVNLIYEDVAYYSQPGKLEGETVQADISIFETTEDPAGVQVDQVHWFIVPLGDRVQVAEYYLVGSRSERTYVGTLQEGEEQRTTVTFHLPDGATSLTFQDQGLGDRFLGNNTAFRDTMPIPPGTATTEIDFSYELPYSEGMELTREMDVPISAVVIIVNGSEVGVEGDGVVFGGMIDTQMGQAASYMAGPLVAGTPLTLRLVRQTHVGTAMGSPEAATTTGRTPPPRDPLIEAVVGGVVLVGAGFGAYRLWRRPSLPPMPEGVEEIVLSLAELDRRHAAGSVNDVEFSRERAALVREITATLDRRSLH